MTFKPHIKTKKPNPAVSQEHPEGQLKEYQARFKTLFDNVSSGVAIYEATNDGEDFVFVDFSPAAEETEQINIKYVPVEDIKKTLTAGKINHTPTIIALQKFLLMKQEESTS